MNNYFVSEASTKPTNNTNKADSLAKGFEAVLTNSINKLINLDINSKVTEKFSELIENKLNKDRQDKFDIKSQTVETDEEFIEKATNLISILEADEDKTAKLLTTCSSMAEFTKIFLENIKSENRSIKLSQNRFMNMAKNYKQEFLKLVDQNVDQYATLDKNINKLSEEVTRITESKKINQTDDKMKETLQNQIQNESKEIVILI